jgi:hypothetical protein
MTDTSHEALASEQRLKYEKIAANVLAGKASQKDAADAIMKLCDDNERLAVICGKHRDTIAVLRAAPVAMRETLTQMIALTDEICTAVDCEAEDIGGQRKSITILRELGQCAEKAKTALPLDAPAPVDPVAEARILSLPDPMRGYGVCVGDRWDSWLFHRHPDGQWVSQFKLDAVNPFFAQEARHD